MKFGIFQTSEDMFDNNDHGLNWSINGEDGYTAIAQFGWSPQFFKRPVSSGASDGKGTPAVMKGMPGHYQVGVTFSQWDFYPRFRAGLKTIPMASTRMPTRWFIRKRRGATRG